MRDKLKSHVLHDHIDSAAHNIITCSPDLSTVSEQDEITETPTTKLKLLQNATNNFLYTPQTQKSYKSLNTFDIFDSAQDSDAECSSSEIDIENGNRKLNQLYKEAQRELRVDVGYDGL